MLVVSVGVAVRVLFGGHSGGAYAGPSVSRSGVPWRGRGSGCLAGWLPAGDCVWTRRVVLEEAALGAMAEGTKDPELDRGLPPKMLAS